MLPLFTNPTYQDECTHSLNTSAVHNLTRLRIYQINISNWSLNESQPGASIPNWILNLSAFSSAQKRSLLGYDSPFLGILHLMLFHVGIFHVTSINALILALLSL